MSSNLIAFITFCSPPHQTPRHHSSTTTHVRVTCHCPPRARQNCGPRRTATRLTQFCTHKRRPYLPPSGEQLHSETVHRQLHVTSPGPARISLPGVWAVLYDNTPAVTLTHSHSLKPTPTPTPRRPTRSHSCVSAIGNAHVRLCGGRTGVQTHFEVVLRVCQFRGSLNCI